MSYWLYFLHIRHNDGQVKSFFVGGPNQRKDYHIEEGEEVCCWQDYWIKVSNLVLKLHVYSIIYGDCDFYNLQSVPGFFSVTICLIFEAKIPLCCTIIITKLKKPHSDC